MASGGNDQLVLLWDLADTMTSLAAAAAPGKEDKDKEAADGGSSKGGKAPQLKGEQ